MTNKFIQAPIVKENIVAFIDSTGRSGFCERVKDLDTADTLAIKNPVVVHVVAQPQGNMALQLLPAFFKEFNAEKDTGIIFAVPKSFMAFSVDAVFDFKLYAQYDAMFAPAPGAETLAAHSQPPAESKRVKLFDE